ncbi:MAG: YHS domain-containing (seleno)protein [Acidimicrobiia bacterium]|nr:YHS domain-containing (seleno)protein [Acidimicrobiia bacterium]
MAKEIKTDKNGLALEGYDTVAYFTEGSPTLGDPSITHEWKGATWHFASVENRETFISNPEEYAPQFGGHCAVARAQGMHVKGSPELWRIEDGKLFLNKNKLASKMHPTFGNRIHKLANRARASA